LDAYQNKDYVTALKEWRPLVERGDANAQYNLGLMYHNGQGVNQDITRAHMWYNIAALQGSEKGLENRDIIANKMTASQIEKTQALASECLAKNYKSC